MTKRHPFNLVEILLALGVIMFGLVCLLGLFPLAAKVTSDATMETYATSAAEELMAFITEQATTAEGSTTADSRWENWISDSSAKIPDAQPSGMLGSDEAAHQEEILKASNWEKVSDRQRRIFRHKTQKGVFMLVSLRGDKGTDQDIDLTDEDDLAKIDSRVLITVWKEPITRTYKTGSTDTDSSYQFGVRLNMMVGWPAERPEAGKDEGKTLRPLRTVRLYSFDLLRPVK